MTTNTAHAECGHPSTKLARATCRRHKADVPTVTIATATMWVLIETTKGYTPRRTEDVMPSEVHRDLLGQGYTCQRIVWDANDLEIALYFQHKTNDTMSAVLRLA